MSRSFLAHSFYLTEKTGFLKITNPVLGKPLPGSQAWSRWPTGEHSPAMCSQSCSPGPRGSEREGLSGTLSKDGPSSLPPAAAVSALTDHMQCPESIRTEGGIFQNLLEKGVAKKKPLGGGQAPPQAGRGVSGSGVPWHLQKRPCEHRAPLAWTAPLANHLFHLSVNVPASLTFGNQSTYPRRPCEHRTNARVCLEAR